jgi:plastocyanin
MTALTLTCAPMSIAAAAAATAEAGPDDAAGHSPGGAARAPATVQVEHLMFMPGRVRVGLGGRVAWTFPETTQHTTTSDQRFWDSGAKSGGATYARSFTSAGKFAYHCSFHPTMRGSVTVGIRVHLPSEAKHVVRWSTAKATGRITFDVQLKVGSGSWTDFRTDTVRPKATFRAATMPDSYKVRARTSRGNQNSGWSRTVRLTFP